MRKHFLILMLLTLLPLAGFATDYTVTLYNASKTYGELDPAHPATSWFKLDPTGLEKATAASNLLFRRETGAANQGENVGNYRYTVEKVSSYTDNDFLVDGNGAFSIKEKDLSSFDGTEGNTITLTLVNKQYVNGTTAIKPSMSDIKVTVDLANDELDGDLTAEDFEIVSYGANNTVGIGAAASGPDPEVANYIVIKGKGNYKGTLKLYFEISGTDIASLGFTPAYVGGPLTYSGEPKTFTDVDGNFTLGNLVAGTDFDIKSGSYQNNTNAGTASVILEGKGAYSGEVTAEFTIAKLAVNSTSAPFVPGLSDTHNKYNGTAQEPVFETGYPKVGGRPLVNNENHTDYVLSNLGTNAGTHTATLTFAENGNFSGPAQSISYTIDPQDFTAANVAVTFTETTTAGAERTQYEYNNADIKPAFKVVYTVDADHKYDLTADDYTFSYTDNNDGNDLKNIGTKKLVVTGKRNFTTASLTAKTYEVTVRTVTVGAEDLTVGMGADVSPVATWTTFPAGHNAATLGLTASFTYKKLNEGGVETGDAIDDIKAAGIGMYSIRPNITALNNAVTNAAAESPLKNYTFVEAGTFAKLEKTNSQVVVQIEDQEITWGEGFPNSGWTVSYVSGLSTADANANTNGSTMNKIIAALDQQLFKTDVTELNATSEGYDVYYDGTITLTPNNYAITVLPGKLKVNKYQVKTTDITIDDTNLTYTGKAATPAVTLTINGNVISPKYYNVTYDTDFKAGTHVAKIVETNTTNFTTNYARSLTALEASCYNADNNLTGNSRVSANSWRTLAYTPKEYTINKVALELTADEATWTYGQPEPTYTVSLTSGAAVAGEESLITNLLDGQIPTGFTGKPVVKRTSANTVGEHADALEISFVNSRGASVNTNVAATNYSFTLKKGKLTVNRGNLVVKVKDYTVPYGETVSDGDLHLEAVSGMDPAETVNFDAIVSYDKEIAKFGYTDACKAINEYTLKYTGAAPIATNYNVSFAEGDAANGTLKVTKRPVTFKAVDSNIAYGATFTPAVNDTYVKQITSSLQSDATYGGYYNSATCYDLLAGDDMNTVIASIAVESMNVGENNIVLTKKASEIYDIILLPGTLTIGNTTDDIVLHRVEKADFDDPMKNTAAAKIAEKDGKFVNVTFTFPGQTMYANKWYTMVLPFATTVRDISNAFGYAVVDVFNTNGNQPDDVSFSLHIGAVNANEPFLIKIDEDITAADFEAANGAPEFKNVKIENPATLEISDAYGNKVVGTYTGKNGDFDADYDWGLGLGQSATDWQPFSTTYLRPLGAYIHYKDRQQHNSRTISIEEPDGSTTVINSITGDQLNFTKDAIYNMNGVKMQGIPTEKGVYIQNGKKIVIK